MTTPQSNLLQLAKQGDAKAIAALLNRQLQIKEITAKVFLKDNCLQVMLEASEVPEKNSLTTFIHKGLIGLGSPKIERVKVYGRQIGKEFPVWSVALDITKERAKSPQEIEGSSSFHQVIYPPISQVPSTQTNSGKPTPINQGFTSKETTTTTTSNSGLTKTHHNSTNAKGKVKNKGSQKDLGFEVVENIQRWITYQRNHWTIRKTAYTLLTTGCFLLTIFISPFSSISGDPFGIILFPISLILIATGWYLLQQSDRKDAEYEITKRVKISVEDYKSKFPSQVLVLPNKFNQTDGIRFAVSDVFYEKKIVAYYEQESLGVLVIDTDWGAIGQSVKGKKPIAVDITGKGVVIEIIVHNTHNSTRTFEHQDFYLIDQNSNQYLAHEASDYVSRLRGGITFSTKLRPGTQVRYFIVFDINPDAVATILTTSPDELSNEGIFFSLDLKQKLVV